jgi:AcrR family transcriptional regulator
MSNLSRVTLALDHGANPGVSDPAEGDGASLSDLNPTEERIVSAALRLIGRRGVKRLGMQEISEAAGVSRGTLYRYFPSKDHVLAAAANYDERRFTQGLADALASAVDPAARIRAFVAFSFDYIRTHPARALFESEPEFVLSYLLDHLPKLQGAVLEQLGEALDSVPAVAAGRLSRAQLTDIIVRLFASSWLIAESDERTLVQSINHILLPS